MELTVQAQEKIKNVDEWLEVTSVSLIDTQEAYTEVTDKTKDIKRMLKDLEALRVSATKPINEGLRVINGMFKTPMERLKKLEAGLKRLMTTWLQDKERKRLEAQREAEELAKKERDRLAKQADKQEAKGKVESAEITRSIAETIVADETQAIDKGAGVWTVTTWEASVVDKNMFVEWCLKSGMLDYLTINESMLKKEAQMSKGGRQWAGIKVEKRVNTRMRS